MSDLPKLIAVPDDLWPQFVDTLSSCGIELVCTDGGRSHKAQATRRKPVPGPYLGDPGTNCGRGGVCALGQGHDGRCRA